MSDRNLIDGAIVLSREHAFAGRLIARVVPGEISIAEIVATTPDLPDRFADEGEVCIDGVPVPRPFWPRVKVKARAGAPVRVTLQLAPAKGDTGRAIAAAAIVVAAIAVSGGALGPLGIGGASYAMGAVTVPIIGTELFAAGSLSAALLSATIAVGGQLALGALAPPPSNAAIAQGGGAPAAGADQGAASLSGNVLARGAAIPAVVGTRRIHPPQACFPLVELVGTDEFVEGVFVLAGPHTMTDVRVGETPATELPDCDIEIQEGFPESPPVSLVQRYGRTEGFGVELVGYKMELSSVKDALEDQSQPANSLPQWVPVFSRGSPEHDPDEIWITLDWPEGLIGTALDDTMNQPLRIRIRRKGDVSWVNLPEIHVHSSNARSFRKDFRIKWGTAPTLPTPDSFRAPIRAFKTVPAQNVTPSGLGGWSAHSHFSAGAGNDVLSAATVGTTSVRNCLLYDDRVEFYLSAVTFPQGVYEIQCMRGQPFHPTNFVESDYTNGGGNIYDFFGYRESSGKFRTVEEINPWRDKVILTRLATVWNRHPVQSNDLAVLAIRAKNRQIDRVSVLASRYTLDWDGTGWNTVTTTKNPAPHLRDIMTGRLNADPLLPEELDPDEIDSDEAGLLAWRSYCDDQGLEVSGVLEGRTALNAMTLVAAAGMARPRMGETWGVIIDRDRSAEAPVQMFTPRNSRGFRWEKAFANAPCGLRMRYDDEDEDYKEREEIVLADDAVDDGTYEDIRYDMLTNRDLALERAAFDLAQLRQRTAFYSFEVPIETLEARNGDLIALQNDVLDARAGFPRLIEVLRDGSDVVGFVFDSAVPTPSEDAFTEIEAAFTDYSDAFLSPRYGVQIRLRDRSTLTAEIAAEGEETRTAWLASPVADPGADVIKRDCLVAAGPLDQEIHRMVVRSAVAKKDFVVAISCVDEANELFAA